MNQESPEYDKWSNEDLIKRVTELEAQLRAQNIKHSKVVSSNSSPSPPKKKPKKTAKPFDSSKYSTRLIALKFAYLGKRYNGFEYHSNNKTPLPTIEEELWKALRKTRLILPTPRHGQSEDEVCWDGCEYSKCGRTDKGVSAFGQVIGLRVRSSRTRNIGQTSRDKETADITGTEEHVSGRCEEDEKTLEPIDVEWDPIKDELPYIQVLNRVLPSDIRILAWCPNPPLDFSARFSCKERRYRYFFTNPAYAPLPGEDSVGTRGGPWLNIQAMQEAAKKLEGLHDFRNFCKIDPSKQITSFQRRIFHASIEPMSVAEEPGAFLNLPPFSSTNGSASDAMSTDIVRSPELYSFEVRGSAFLWHQVRHMVAILFLVGQGYEDPGVVDALLDVGKMPGRPMYDMASDTPLVLLDCVFPDLETNLYNDHRFGPNSGYEDALDWIYIGDTGTGENPDRRAVGVEDRKYGRLSITEDLWALWWKKKLDEVLAGSLMDVVARQGKPTSKAFDPDRLKNGEISSRVFDGSETPRTVGTYIPIVHRERMETPEVVNARYATRKGWNTANGDAADMDE